MPHNGSPEWKAKHTQVWHTANWHMTVMLTVTVIVIIDVIVRLLQFPEGYTELSTMILSILAGALVSHGATYGGSLVYDYQFNVESLEGKTVWDETEVDQNPGMTSLLPRRSGYLRAMRTPWGAAYYAARHNLSLEKADYPITIEFTVPIDEVYVDFLCAAFQLWDRRVRVTPSVAVRGSMRSVRFTYTFAISLLRAALRIKLTASRCATWRRSIPVWWRATSQTRR